MKKLIIILFLLPLFANGQELTTFRNLDSLQFSKEMIELLTLKPSFEIEIGTISQVHTISILSSNSKKQLNLDIVGDSIKVSGGLQLDSAAALFFKYIIECNSRTIDSLKNEIIKLKLTP